MQTNVIGGCDDHRLGDEVEHCAKLCPLIIVMETNVICVGDDHGLGNELQHYAKL